MARTGNFGQSPRAYPSLDNTLVAIARQWQEQRAQNIMDAWQKGGMFEGQKATDELILKFWKDRTNAVSKDDPLYDTYNNAHMQLDYTIHESKMTAQYATGKASDAQMIHFYLGWSKKVPKNSEFYRVLQRDAGQYMRNQKNASIAAQRQAEEDKYQREQASTRKTKEAGAEYIVETLRRVAQSGYADAGIAAPIGAPGSGSDFSDFDPGDPEAMLKLLNVIDPTVRGIGGLGGSGGPERSAGNTDTIYHDDNGKPVTGVDIMKKLQDLVPGFVPGQKLDTSFISGLIDSQLQGLDERIARAQKTGHMTDVKNLTDAKAYFATVKRQVAAWPVIKSYDELRATRDSSWNDPTATPKAQIAADDAYKAGLTSLLNDPRIAADDNLRSRIAAELRGSGDVPTIAQSTTGLEQGTSAGQAAGDQNAPSIANDAAHRAFLEDQINQVDSGNAVWSYGTTNPHTNVFTPGPGAEIGAVPPEQIAAIGGQPQVVTVMDPMGGGALTVQAMGTPIYAKVTDANGNEIAATNSNPIGYEYKVYKGGAVVTSYGFQSKDNGWVVSNDPPWGNDLPAIHRSDGGNRLEVDFSSVYQDTINAHGGTPVAGNYGNGITGKANRSGGVVMSFNPQDLSYSTDERHVTGSNDPTTDFHSLTLATYTQTAEGLRDLKLAMNDTNSPLYKQLYTDAVKYAGGQFDDKGQLIPNSMDQNKFDAAMGVANRAASSMNFEDFVAKGGTQWSRDQTGSAFAGGDTSKPELSAAQQAGVQYVPGVGMMPLPSDALRGVQGWDSLAGVFKPGTSNFVTAGKAVDDRMTIKTQGTITVPNMPAFKPVQGITAGPTSVQTATQQSGPIPTGTSQQGGASGNIPYVQKGHEQGQGGMGGY